MPARRWRRREDIEPTEARPVDLKRHKSNIWTVLLLIAFISFLLGTYFAYRELLQFYM